MNNKHEYGAALSRPYRKSIVAKEVNSNRHLTTAIVRKLVSTMLFAIGDR